MKISEAIAGLEAIRAEHGDMDMDLYLDGPRGDELCETKFRRGDYVKKVSGSDWRGAVVGEYSTDLTPEGYCVESAAHSGSVQIYPAAALERWVVDERRFKTRGNA